MKTPVTDPASASDPPDCATSNGTTGNSNDQPPKAAAAMIRTPIMPGVRSNPGRWSRILRLRYSHFSRLRHSHFSRHRRSHFSRHRRSAPATAARTANARRIPDASLLTLNIE